MSRREEGFSGYEALALFLIILVVFVVVLAMLDLMMTSVEVVRVNDYYFEIEGTSPFTIVATTETGESKSYGLGSSAKIVYDAASNEQQFVVEGRSGMLHSLTYAIFHLKEKECP